MRPWLPIVRDANITKLLQILYKVNKLFLNLALAISFAMTLPHLINMNIMFTMKSNTHVISNLYFHFIFFHRCVPHDQCGGILNVRGEDSLVCMDTKMTCCHESVLKVANETSNSETDYYDQEQELCSSYENEGFR